MSLCLMMSANNVLYAHTLAHSFHPEVVSYAILQNVDYNKTYTAPHRRRWHSS
jgi:hypothetical protein